MRLYWVYYIGAFKTNVITAFVIGPITRAQFVAKYGQPVHDGWRTKLEAAAVAAKFNAQSPDNRQTPGTHPYAPSVLTDPSGKLPGSNLSNPLAGVNAIGDFFNRLTQPNTWIRVGEVAAGLILVYLGLSATMRGTEAQRQISKAKGTAKKVAAVAAK